MPKRTFQPNKRKRSKKHGFRTRMKTKSGAAVLSRRRAKGRKRVDLGGRRIIRSEEHTLNSSHQIISYAVFCLKKKKIARLRSVVFEISGTIRKVVGLRV